MQLLHFGMLLSAFVGILLDELFIRPASELSLSLSFGLITAVGCAGKFLTYRAGQRIIQSPDPRSSLYRLDSHLHSILWIWCLIAPCYLTGIGWGALSKSLAPGIDSTTWVFAWWSFPNVLVLTLFDTARNQLSCVLGSRAVLRARYGWLIAFVPCLASCILWDLFQVFIDRLDIPASMSPIVAMCVMSTAMAIGFPLLMVRLWSTERLDGDQPSADLIQAWVSSGGNPRAVLKWKTESTIASAMVIGWFRPFRFLLLSDLLLERLNQDELRMIVLHEAAHCQRWHVWLRMLPILIMALPVVSIQNRGLIGLALGGLFQASPVLEACITLLSIVTMCFLLSWMARWSELDADAFAVRSDVKKNWFFIRKIRKVLDEGSSSVPSDRQRRMFDQQMAARVLIQALKKLVPAEHARKETWLHPSLERRIHSLEKQYLNGRLGLVESIDDLGCFSSPL